MSNILPHFIKIFPLPVECGWGGGGGERDEGQQTPETRPRPRHADSLEHDISGITTHYDCDSLEHDISDITTHYECDSPSPGTLPIVHIQTWWHNQGWQFSAVKVMVWERLKMPAPNIFDVITGRAAWTFIPQPRRVPCCPAANVHAKANLLQGGTCIRTNRIFWGWVGHNSEHIATFWLPMVQSSIYWPLPGV